MARLTLQEGLLLNFEERIPPGRREYLPKEQAYQRLREVTGQDFGTDFPKWWAYLRERGLLTPQLD